MRTHTFRIAGLGGTVAILAACWPAGMAAATPTPATEASADRVHLDRRLHDDRINESSGLARSTYKRRVLWTHNDKGGAARLFAVGGRGNTRAVVTLAGVEATDWEDIATGPRHTLWVGDIGDNKAVRDRISVYRLREPGELQDMDRSATRFDFSYPGGPRNAEGLMVNPRTGRVLVVTKSGDGGAIFRAPKEPRTDRVNQLRRVAAAPPKVTAASFGPRGRSFVLTNDRRVFVYRGLGGSPRRIGKPDLEQGESAEVTRRGDAVLVGSEGANSPVYRIRLS